MKTCSNYPVSQQKGTQNQQPHCQAVLVERFLQPCFNKLPYVSICSTTGESELTFQRAAPCALWTHQPQVSTPTSSITLNDRLTDWRPSVITPEYCPSHPPLFSTSSHEIKKGLFCPTNWTKSSFYSNCSLAFCCQKRLALCSLKKQQTSLSCRGGQHASLLGASGTLNTIIIWVGAVCVCVCVRWPVASSSPFPKCFFSQRA